MKRQQEDNRILLQIQPIKAQHPLWGYRRVWSYMKYRQHQSYNKKRIYRIMKEHRLLVTPQLRLRAKRSNRPYASKPRATCPNQFWGTDMTKIMIPSYGWLYLVIVLDWYTKKIIGYHISPHCRTEQWLDALNMACNTQFPEGVAAKHTELFLISDNGSQPTSKNYMKACSLLQITQIFASYNNPKGNADTERVMRTIKEDFIWVNEFSSPQALLDGFRKWVRDYNTDYPHSSLNHMTPCEFEQHQIVHASNF